MLLKNLIKVLGEEFGTYEVVKEAMDQYDVERVRTLAKSLASTKAHKIPRIKVARTLFNLGLKEAKEWVEANFSNGGDGDPI